MITSLLLLSQPIRVERRNVKDIDTAQTVIKKTTCTKLLTSKSIMLMQENTSIENPKSIPIDRFQ